MRYKGTSREAILLQYWIPNCMKRDGYSYCKCDGNAFGAWHGGPAFEAIVRDRIEELSGKYITYPDSIQVCLLEDYYEIID